MKNYVLLLVLSIMFSSCFKTAEEIKREKLIDQQLDQSSKIIANLTIQLSDLKGGLATTSGQIEEIDHKRKQYSEEQKLTYSQSIAQLTEQVKNLTEEHLKTQSQVANLSKQVQTQKKYISKVTGALSKMNDSPPSGKNLLKKAHKSFEKNKKKQALTLYHQVLQESKISNAQKNHVYFNIGLLNFWNKKYNDALVYFSKIYTKYPKSSFAPRSLLYIARSFNKTNKADAANASYAELIKNYPKNKHADTARKEMK